MTRRHLEIFAPSHFFSTVSKCPTGIKPMSINGIDGMEEWTKGMIIKLSTTEKGLKSVKLDGGQGSQRQVRCEDRGR